MMRNSCEDTDHCGDSARECNAPLNLPHHDPENETWDHNEGQDPDSHPHLRPVGVGSGLPVSATLYVSERMVDWMLVVVLRRGREVGIVGSLTGVLGLLVVVLVLERNSLGRKLVTAGFYRDWV